MYCFINNKIKKEHFVKKKIISIFIWLNFKFYTYATFLDLAFDKKLKCNILLFFITLGYIMHVDK